jgi:hypothetical protein
LSGPLADEGGRPVTLALFMACSCKKGACKHHKEQCAACCALCESRAVGRPKGAAAANVAAVSEVAAAAKRTRSADAVAAKRTRGEDALAQAAAAKRQKGQYLDPAAEEFEYSVSEVEPAEGSLAEIRSLFLALKLPWSRSNHLPALAKRKSGTKTAMSTKQWNNLVQTASAALDAVLRTLCPDSEDFSELRSALLGDSLDPVDDLVPKMVAAYVKGKRGSVERRTLCALLADTLGRQRLENLSGTIAQGFAEAEQAEQAAAMHAKRVTNVRAANIRKTNALV